jgi:hypothetical protein
MNSMGRCIKNDNDRKNAIASGKSYPFWSAIADQSTQIMLVCITKNKVHVNPMLGGTSKLGF